MHDVVGPDGIPTGTATVATLQQCLASLSQLGAGLAQFNMMI